MTQLAAGNVQEADVMAAAIVAFAKPHIDTAADVMLRASGDVAAILDNIPQSMAERAHLVEFIAIAKRYAGLLGLEEPPVQEQAPTLGVARRLAIGRINEQADTRVDAIVIAWARGADLPVMEVSRLTDAALVTAATITNKRAIGLELTSQELALETGLQLMQQRQSEIRTAQRDHVREIDRLEDLEAVRAYPDTAVWPEA